MKGNISRDSHRPEDRYSAVFQVQGGMVTDADLGEQAKIARRRTDGLGHDTAGCGVPLEDGAVRIDGGGPRLAEGIVYAGGVRGETRATGLLTGPLSLYDAQLDFPLAPPLPQTGELIIYADIWERMVSRLEEPLLADPGLHGAETAFRARTMAQIKFAPASQAGVLGRPDGPVPRIGGGVLSVTPVDPETIADECDPCADVVAAEQTVANGLFRIEVVHVFGDPQTPEQIRIAWSAENASAIAPADVNVEDFSRAGAVYEFFSHATETHLGVHEANGDVARSSFASSLGGGPEDPDAPEGGDWPFVRRWSGAVLVDFAAGTVARVGGGGGVSVTGRRITLTVDAFAAEIDLTGRPVVAGDYWLIETRRFAETPIRAVREMPIGIRHNYCPLFRVTDGAIVALSDEERRRLSFPALANLPATHVGFVNNCPNLYDDAENLQEALDNLCAIDASDIAFDPSDCPRLFDNSDNVQDALSNLCKVDFGAERLLRLLHDWGVVCGVIPARARGGPAMVSYSDGAILDRAGALGDVKGTTVDLNKLMGTEFFHFADFTEFDKLIRAKQVCLALAIGEGGIIDAHLVPKDIAFAPYDPTLLSVFAECREKRPPFDPKDDFSALAEKERVALDKVVYGAANPKLAAGQRLNAEEQRIARKYNDELISRYKAHVNDPFEAAFVDQNVKAIDETLDPGGATGEVRETRFLQREAAVYGWIREREAERLRECLCSALMPRCPTPGKPPHLVPIACLEGSTEGGEIVLHDICVFGCRKQAMSWRMVQYYVAELRDQFARWLEKGCCPPDEGGGVIGRKPSEDLISAGLEQLVTPEFFGLQAEKSLRIVTGRNPPNDYRVKPSIEDLGVEQARTALGGNGVEVIQTIDVTDADAIKKIRGASVGIEARDLVFDDGAVAPGDKVALIVQDGVAIDYVKVQTGAGKFLFDRGAATDLLLSEDARGKAQAAVAELEGKIKAAEDTALAADADLTARLEARREEIAKEAAEAEVALEAMRASRAELTSELRSVRNEIDAARAELTKLTEDQKVVLDQTAKERDELVTSIRREMPVTAVVKEEKFVVALATLGVTNLAGLAELPDREVQVAAREAGINLNIARRLKRDAAEKLAAPIR